MRIKLLSLLIGLTFSFNVFGQDEKKVEWEVSDPPGEGWNWKNVNFTTEEGTWMGLDVSPDGQTIVFDMLGDIYTMPIAEGKQKRFDKT